MNIKERMEAFWAGEKPDRIPITIYSFFCHDWQNNPEWTAMADAGLGFFGGGGTVAETVEGLEFITENFETDGKPGWRQIHRTPVGEVTTVFEGGWRQKYLVETAEDYRVMTWIAEHTQLEPYYEGYIEQEAKLGPHAILAPAIGRTPIQVILVDYVGLQNFAFHLFDFEDEIMALYAALLRNFKRRVEIVAGGPGTYISCLENFTAETLGPKRYEELILPVYNECFPVIQQAGKIVGVHYDGKLDSCKDLIAGAPMDLIESLTGPPEGDMTYDVCRAAWPEKLFWVNLNVSDYQLPPATLRARVLESVEQAAVDGRQLAFEVSEDLPANWRESIPVVMDALAETAG